jgi:hypothetical protein
MALFRPGGLLSVCIPRIADLWAGRRGRSGSVLVQVLMSRVAQGKDRLKGWDPKAVNQELGARDILTRHLWNFKLACCQIYRSPVLIDRRARHPFKLCEEYVYGLIARIIRLKVHFCILVTVETVFVRPHRNPVTKSNT